MNKLDLALKEAKKEQQVLQDAKNNLERDILHLKTQHERLKGTTDGLKTRHKLLTNEVNVEQHRLEELRTNGAQLLLTNDRLQADRDAAIAELKHLEASVDAKKASAGKELEDYEVVRKQEIKQSILAVNRQLVDAQNNLEKARQDLVDTTENLRQINEAAIAEQQELKQIQATAKEIIAEDNQKVVAIEQELTSRKRELQQILHQHDQAKSARDKAEIEHKQFVEYETKARKLLDNKDRELQEKSSELTTQSQFIQNKRSYLTDM